MTGQPRVEILPKSETEFFLPAVNARINFVPQQRWDRQSTDPASVRARASGEKNKQLASLRESASP